MLDYILITIKNAIKVQAKLLINFTDGLRTWLPTKSLQHYNFFIKRQNLSVFFITFYLKADHLHPNQLKPNVHLL